MRTIFVALAVAPALAFADAAHPVTDELGGLLFVTPRGRFLLSFSADASITDRDVLATDLAGRRFTGTGSRGGVGAGASVLYGLADGLRVGVHAGYLVTAQNFAPLRPAESTGFHEPTFTLAYGRFLDDAPRTFLDLTLSGAPSFGDARAPSGDTPGNALDGQSWATFGAELTNVDDLAFSGSAQLGWVGASREIDGAGFTTGSSLPWGATHLGVASRAEAPVRWSGGASVRFPFTRDFLFTGGSHASDAHHARFSLGTTLEWAPSRTLMVGGSLSWSVENVSSTADFGDKRVLETTLHGKGLSVFCSFVP